LHTKHEKSTGGVNVSLQ